MKRVFLFLTEGFEEIEALTVVDLLRRAQISVKMISVTGNQMVTGAHKIEVKADELFENADFSKGDMLILPGGSPGTDHLDKCDMLIELLKQYNQEGKAIGAICAAPRILGRLGILFGKKACCYPGNEDKLAGAKISENEVETDGNIVTSRGAGTAVAFSAAIISKLCSKEESDTLLNQIIYRQ